VLEIHVDPGKRLVFAQDLEQVFAHPHQLFGAAGHRIEAAQQLLPARLGNIQQPRERGCIAVLGIRLGLPVKLCRVDVELAGQAFEERQFLIIVSVGVILQKRACGLQARDLTSVCQQRLPKCQQITCVGFRRRPLAALKQAGKQILQVRDAAHTAGPISVSGSHVARPGNRQSRTIASTMHATNGSDPTRMVRSEISGAMPLMT
jgi:hypothetical protein